MEIITFYLIFNYRGVVGRNRHRSITRVFMMLLIIYLLYAFARAHMYMFVVTFLMYDNILCISELNEAIRHMEIMVACKMITDGTKMINFTTFGVQLIARRLLKRNYSD